jgi:hypothetical protein
MIFKFKQVRCKIEAKLVEPILDEYTGQNQSHSAIIQGWIAAA